MAELIKGLTAFVIVSIASVCSFGQKKTTYITLDSMHMVGRIYDQTGSSLKFLRNGEIAIETYTASQVTEYSDGNDLYRSFLLNDSYFFFKEIINGKASLYELSSKYYILHQDSVFVELNDSKGEYQIQLKELVKGCSGLAESIHQMKYAKKSLLTLIKAYNSNSCNQFRFPRFRMGVYGGYMQGSVKFDQRTGIDYETESQNVIPGVYCESPILNSYRFFFNAEVFFDRIKYSYFKERSVEDRVAVVNLKYDLKSVVIPLSIKYSISNRKLHAYIKAGCTFHIRFDSKELLMESSEYETSTVIDVYQISNMTILSFGVIGGVGIEYPITPKNSLFLESRFLSWNIERNDGAQSKFQNVGIILGLNF